MSTCFRREGDAQKNATSGDGSRKRKYLYFAQLLILLPHLVDRETQSNLSIQRSEDEEEANNSQEEEEKERPRTVRKMKQVEISHEESLLHILRQKKMDDTNLDEDNCFLLFPLPSLRQFNDEQKFLARMEILKIMRHVKQ